MVDKRNTKTQLLDHSKAKVGLLRKYLDRYLNIISNDGFTQQIEVFDLFCGEGIYTGGGEGSPLTILRAVKDLYFANRAKGRSIPTINCHFNDKDKTKVEKVKAAITEKSLSYPEFGNVTYSTERYEIEVRNLIELFGRLKKHKYFVFIDPYGYRHIKAGQIKGLLANRNAEVLLFLPTQFMYRFEGDGTPESLSDLLDELVDIRNWRKSDSVWTFIDQLKKAWKAHLGDNFFVSTFTIEKDPQTVFCLFFFSSHIKGFEKMLEAKWQIDADQGKGWNYKNASRSSLFETIKTNPLEQKIRAFIGNETKTNKEMYEFTLQEEFLPKHANEVLRNLQINGCIEVLEINGTNARRNSFYLAYNHAKTVIFRLK